MIGTGERLTSDRLAIALHQVSHRFQGLGRTVIALEDVTLEIARERFVSIVGPSGCGKSTLLAIIAGLLLPTSGQVFINGSPVTDVCQDLGFIFQKDALMPWKTVYENIALPLLFRRFPREEIHDRVMSWIKRVGLTGFEDHYPYQLSGGMRKRVALAQTLVYEPSIILMDEPFTALDVHTRDRMENELLHLWSGLKSTIVFVTHDLEEAIALSDEVVVFTARPGRVKARHSIDLPRPRNVAEIRASPEFLKVYRMVWEDLRDEVVASYGQQGD
ncbi:MAG: ABC transporter ATP-binding protein [Armatimonadota bacterium]|nr:ABC transporter ATP-binding protein [Armatimonadota bacterium]